MSLRKNWKWLVGAALVLVVGAGAAAVWLGGGRPAFAGRPGEQAIPTARVERGNLEIKVYGIGELRASNSAQLIVPPVSGSLQIVHLLPTGTRVKEGDLVVEFDPSEQEYNLEQSRSEVLQAEQEITKAKADTAVQTAQDKVALLKARFEVRRAELEVGRNELVSAIDAKKNLLNLEEAKRKLEQLGQDITSRRASSQANLAVLEEKRNKARLGMTVAEQNIKNMQMRAPMSGLVSAKENWQGVFRFGPGMVVPEYRQGDLTSSGQTVAEILDVEHMEIVMRVAESERSNLKTGQSVDVQLHALPGRSYTGKVKTVSGMVSRGFSFGPSGPTRMFDVVIELERPDERMRTGVTAQVVVSGDQVKNALLLPRQAIFEKDGKPVVYVRSGSGFTPQEVKVKQRTESQVAVENLSEGAEVALVNPEAPAQKPGKAPAKAAGPSITGGGR